MPPAGVQRLDVHLAVMIRDLPPAPVFVVALVLDPVAEIGRDFPGRRDIDQTVIFDGDLLNPSFGRCLELTILRSVSSANPEDHELANHCINAPL